MVQLRLSLAISSLFYCPFFSLSHRLETKPDLVLHLLPNTQVMRVLVPRRPDLLSAVASSSCEEASRQPALQTSVIMSSWMLCLFEFTTFVTLYFTDFHVSFTAPKDRTRSASAPALGTVEQGGLLGCSMAALDYTAGCEYRHYCDHWTSCWTDDHILSYCLLYDSVVPNFYFVTFFLFDCLIQISLKTLTVKLMLYVTRKVVNHCSKSSLKRFLCRFSCVLLWCESFLSSCPLSMTLNHLLEAFLPAKLISISHSL